MPDFSVLIRRKDDHRQVAVRAVDLAEEFHHLEAIQVRHVQVQRDEIGSPLTVHLLDAAWVGEAADVPVPLVREHLLEQLDVGRLVVNDQHLGG